MAFGLAALSVLIAQTLIPAADAVVILQVQNQPAQRNVARIGVNLGTWTSWGAEQLGANVIMNPGFESTIDRAIVIVSHNDKNGFEDGASWLSRPDGFWRGANYEVISGAAAGDRGIVKDSLRVGPHGMPLYETEPSPHHLAAGDVVALTRENDQRAVANWWITDSSSVARIDLDDAKCCPASSGAGALRLTPDVRGPVIVSSYLDAITGRAGKLLPIRGLWRLQFWSRADGNVGASLRVTFGRVGSTPFLDRTIEPSTTWRLTSIDFAGRDEEVLPATLELRFAVSGTNSGSVLLDAVDLQALSSASTSFRSEVIAALRVLHPGYLRDWQGQLGDTLANRLAPPFARHPTRYRPGEETQYSYSLPEFLDLCQSVGALPWIVVPTTFSAVELTGLGKFLAAQNTSRRFSEIVLEFGNENWNEIFRPAGIPDPKAYAEVADRAFQLIRQGAGPALRLTMVVGGQFANPDLTRQVAANAASANSVAIAPYFLYSLRAESSDRELLTALFDDSESDFIAFSRSARDLKKTLAVYEVNLHTTGGNAEDAQRNRLVAGAAAGTALARRIIQSLNAGVKIQIAYVLAGFDASTDRPGGLVRLWGLTRDLAAAPRLRPTGLAIALINQAMGGDFYNVPTNNSKISAAAFLIGSRWSAILASADARPLAVRIQFPESLGQLPERLLRLASNSPFSTNEGQAQVTLVESIARPHNRSITVTMPPYGLLALLAGGPGQGPS